MKEMLQANARLLLLTVLILSNCAVSLAYYHPEEGRFLSRDPIVEKGGVGLIVEKSGVGLYTFVRNDPIRRIDYLGLWDVPPWVPSWLNDLLSSPTDPRDQSPPPPLYECPSVDGFYRHCVATCRVNRVLQSPIITMLIALYAGGDFEWGGNHTYDQLADVIGIINSTTLSCRDSCLGPTRAIIKLKCCGKNDKK